MDRKTSSLSRNIPKRDIKTSQCEACRAISSHALEPPLKVSHDASTVERITSDSERRKHATYDFNRGATGGESERFSPAGYPRICFDPKINCIHREAWLTCAHQWLGSPMLIGESDMDRFNLADFHAHACGWS
jgi:hypothetical protein